jgi:hypothetical protein
MTANEFYEILAALDEAGSLTLKPGPVTFKICRFDVLAGQLLQWLYEQMPGEATVQDCHEVLDAAKFWFTFWTSLDKEVTNAET